MTALDMRIGPETARFAVLGEKLGHSWSPYIHNSLFAAAGRNAVYLPFPVPPQSLSSAVDVFRSSLSGFNVTIPYKERIIPLLDEIDGSALACGAVNTVVCDGERLIGYNTDGTGMLRALREGGVKTACISALVLGGGGAARAAGYAFLSQGGRVAFAVRDVRKGERLVSELAQAGGFARDRLAVLPMNEISGAYDVLVNCTPVGMSPNTDACPVGEEIVTRCGAVFDAVYNPRTTRLLACAQRLGIPAVEGLVMLYYQAVEAQRLWFGETGVLAKTERDIYDALLTQL